MIGRTRMAALGAVLSTLVAACGPGLQSGAGTDNVPSPPPIRQLGPTEPIVPDNGLHHLVVTIPRHASSSPEWKPGRVGGDGAEQELTLTVEMLADLPGGVTLVAEGGVLGYRNGNGELVELGPAPLRSDDADGDPVSVNGLSGNGAAPDSIDASAVAERLASLPDVESVAAITETSYAVTAASLEVFERLGVAVADDGFLALAGDPYEPYQWPLDNRGDNLDQLPLPSVPVQSIDADVDGLEARSGATGAGVVVAVVDSGVDFAHPDLAGAAWVNPGEDCGSDAGNGLDDDGNGFVDDCTGWDFGHDDPVGYDGGNNAHGTHVAGIIAATAGNDVGIAGLAPDAEIMDLRVDSPDGVIRASAIARAIRYATDNGADIVNLSLGSQPGASPETVDEIDEAVEYAAERGVLLVAAAGNNAVSLDDSPVYPASLDAANMIVVAASSPDDGPADFSNTGSPVDVFAPGELVLSTVPGDGLAFHSGTSQAAPLVAAAAALVLEQQPDLAPVDVVRLLTSTGDGNENLWSAGAGAGRLNAATAIGIDVVDEKGPGSVTVNGLADDDNGLVSATISLDVDGGQFNQPFHWEASLVTIIDGDPYAVTRHPVSAGQTEAGSVASGADEVKTDERGAVYLADQDSSSASWSTRLPAGLYALVIEAVPRTDSTVRLGDAYLVTFTVGDGPGDGGSGDDVSGDDDGPVDGGDDSSADESADDNDDGEAETGGGGENSDDVELDPDAGSTTGDGGAGDEAGDQTSDGVSDDGAPGEGGSGRESDADGSAEDRRSDTATNDRPDRGSDGRGDDDDPQNGDDAADADDPPDGGDSDDDSDLDPDDGEIELGPDRARNGEWYVTDIKPRTGWVDTENLVQITGTFPGSVEVWFDDNPGYVEFQSGELLVVRTGRHRTAGPVDVTLVARTGEPALTLPHAYAFLDPDDDTGTGRPGDGSDSSAGGSDADEPPDFDLGPGDGTSVGEPPIVSDGAGSGGDGNPRSRNRQARAELIGEPKVLGNKLRVIALDGLSAIGGVPACNEDPCRTRRI